MCSGVLSSCKDTQNIFNSPSWECKVQGCNEQGEKLTLEFEYLHVLLSLLWDGRNGNLQAFALRIAFGNPKVYPACESVTF